MSLESIVRPYQEADGFTARVLPPVQQTSVDTSPVVFFWGDPSSLISKAIGVQKIVFGVQQRELSRQTNTVRIKNPQDETQFVDVQRITQMLTTDEHGQRYQWQFNPP